MTAIRREIAALDPRQPIHNVATMEWMIEPSLATRQSVLYLAGGLAVLAAMFAATGLYALLAYRVQQARREIGIRIALGASVSEVPLVVLRRGLLVAIGGCVAGLACAAVFSRALTGLLYGVEPVEPSIYAEVAALLFAMALLASAIPALRAMSVDPAETLKAE